MVHRITISEIIFNVIKQYAGFFVVAHFIFVEIIIFVQEVIRLKAKAKKNRNEKKTLMAMMKDERFASIF